MSLSGGQRYEIWTATGPGNVNLPYMLQHLAGWIMQGERESRNEARLAEAESMILEAKTLFVRHYGENHGSTVTADTSLATLAHTRGDLARQKTFTKQLSDAIRREGIRTSTPWST